MKKCFWYYTDEVGEKTIVYVPVKDTSKIPITMPIMAEYFNDKGKKEVVQYIVKKVSKEWDTLVKILKLSEKDRLIEKKPRKNKLK